MNTRSEVPSWARAEASHQVDPWEGKKITPPQRDYILNLLQYKQLPDRPDMEGRVDTLMKCLRISEDPEELGMTKAKASEIITWLKDLPNKPNEPSGMWADHNEVPAGRYAVDAENGELRFYHVWRPKGNPSVYRLYVLHGPDSSPVHFKAQMPIMAKIAADVRGAAIRYGREIKACSNCGRRLTNRISRELGIGPVCGGRMFDDGDWKQEVKDARQRIVDRGEDPDEDIE